MSVITMPHILEEKLTPEGAEALVTILNKIEDRSKDNTLEIAEGRFEKRLIEVKSELKADISNVKTSLIQWMIMLLFAQTAIILTVISLLNK